METAEPLRPLLLLEKGGSELSLVLCDACILLCTAQKSTEKKSDIRKIWPGLAK
jgi:hypothetical protein